MRKRRMPQAFPTTAAASETTRTWRAAVRNGRAAVRYCQPFQIVDTSRAMVRKRAPTRQPQLSAGNSSRAIRGRRTGLECGRSTSVTQS